MSKKKFTVLRCSIHGSPQWCASFETLQEATEFSKKSSVAENGYSYRICDDFGKVLDVHYMGDGGSQPQPTYPTFRLPELPLESMQAGDCIRVPVEDYTYDQIRMKILEAKAGMTFYHRHIEHAHHTLVRRIA